MYNVFRFTGRYPEAAYVRELFDVVNTFFREKLTAVPSIRTYFEALQRGPGG